VRGWLRRLRSRAGAMRQDAMTIFGCITGGRDAPYPEPPGSPLGDALSAVAACARRGRLPRPHRGGLGAPAGPVRPGPLPRPRARQLIPGRQPGLPRALVQAATLTMSIRRRSRRAPPSS
jgi:hypothetical protein